MFEYFYFTRRVIAKKSGQTKFISLLTCEPPEPGDADSFIYGTASTKTIKCLVLPAEYAGLFDAVEAEKALDGVLAYAEEHLTGDPSTWYKHYTIPKRSGEPRPIDEPLPELSAYLYNLMDILRKKFFAMYHDAAYAYVKYRNTKQCLEQHRQNTNFIKVDFKNFFGSTTLYEAMTILQKIYPFNFFCETEERKAKLRKALSYAFLNGGLPQGTCISPMLTNLLMIPFDYEINHRGLNMIYTRYADDLLFSSRSRSVWNREQARDARSMMVKTIYRTLCQCGYPYRLNAKKTRVCSRLGKNWNLGLMLNQYNEITIGHENIRKLKADLWNLVQSVKKNKPITKEWLQKFEGRYHYYQLIQPTRVDQLASAAISKGYRRYYWGDINTVFRIARFRAK